MVATGDHTANAFAGLRIHLQWFVGKVLSYFEPAQRPCFVSCLVNVDRHGRRITSAVKIGLL
jgi:hypothetical protein